MISRCRHPGVPCLRSFLESRWQEKFAFCVILYGPLPLFTKNEGGGVTIILLSWHGHQKWFEITVIPRGRCGSTEEDRIRLGEPAGCIQLRLGQWGILCYNWIWIDGSGEFKALSSHPPHRGVSYCGSPGQPDIGSQLKC